MRDDFKLLDEPRRPWIDPETLKQKFLERSSALHPDRFHNAKTEDRLDATRRYTELNAAYQQLRDPRDRLLHLLELELGAKPETVREPPREMIEVGFQVGQLCRDVDDFLARQTEVTSPMLKVQGFQKAQEWSERLVTLKKQLTGQHQHLLAELEELNPVWESARNSRQPLQKPPFARIEEIYTLLSYLNRWISQLEERTVQLFL